jgi:hypothetical protein
LKMLCHPILLSGFAFTDKMQALCIARMDKTTFPEIFKACTGIVLMGTPHRGTGKFTSEELMLRIINAEIPFELSAPDVLKPNNETLVSLVEDFTKLINDPNVRDRLKIFCFFEEIPTTASDVLKNVVNNARLDRSIVKVRIFLHRPLHI